jgi:hypothetical protein
MDLYLHFPIRLHGIVLSWLSTETTSFLIILEQHEIVLEGRANGIGLFISAGEFSVITRYRFRSSQCKLMDKRTGTFHEYVQSFKDSNPLPYCAPCLIQFSASLQPTKRYRCWSQVGNVTDCSYRLLAHIRHLSFLPRSLCTHQSVRSIGGTTPRTNDGAPSPPYNRPASRNGFAYKPNEQKLGA